MSDSDTHIMNDELAAPVEKKSRWEDYIDIFISPASVFRRRADDRVAPPLITLMLLGMAFYYLLLPANGIVIRSQMAAAAAQSGKPVPVMPEKMGLIVELAGGIGVPIMMLVMTAIVAALLWGLARLVDSKPTFHDMMIVGTYAGFILLLSQIATGVATMIHGEEGFDMMKHTSFGLLRFMNTENMAAPVKAILSQIDVFKIWYLVVLAIGFQVLTGVSRAKAAIVAGLICVLSMVPVLFAGNKTAVTPPAAVQTSTQ